MNKLLLAFLMVIVLSCKSIKLENAANSLDPNAPISQFLDQEWVLVPANAGGMGLPSFYVMKYEAKAFNDANLNGQIDSGEIDAAGTAVTLGTNIPASVADNAPWTNITAANALSECESLGANYTLISNPQWIAISRDLEFQNANWTGGTVGSGCLITGNSGDTTCGYDAASDPDFGTGRNVRAKHILSNGQEIFDFGANLYEWVDWDSSTAGYQGSPVSCSSSWQELTAIGGCGFNSDDYSSTNGTLDSSDGAGQIYVGSGSTVLRGGRSTSGIQAGIFNAFMNQSLTYSSTNAGFRCVYQAN